MILRRLRNTVHLDDLGQNDPGQAGLDQQTQRSTPAWPGERRTQLFEHTLS